MPAAELLRVEVPAGGRGLVASDLLLSDRANPVSESSTAELAQVIESWSGPGVVVVAGNLFEMLATPASPQAALASHPRLAAALAGFAAGADRRVVVLPGSRDARLAWDDRLASELTSRTGAELAMAAELVVATGPETRTVRIEGGQRFDPRFAVSCPFDPAETPLGYHLVAETLQHLRSSREAGAPSGPSSGTTSGLLSGIERLSDISAVPRFVASRVAYRRVARHAWWLLVPFAVALALKAPVLLAFAFLGRHRAGLALLGHRLVVLDATTILDLVLVAAGIAYLARRGWAALAGATAEAGDPNTKARAHARSLVEDGAAGLISGHSRSAELTPLGPGFYASPGACGAVIEEVQAHLGLPKVFMARREVSFVEIEAGADLHVRLVHSRVDLPGATAIERLVALNRKSPQKGYSGARPEVVASFPGTGAWPPQDGAQLTLRRARRLAAAAIGAVGLIELVSAVTPPLRHRLSVVLHIVPLQVPVAAAALSGLFGLALLLLAQSVRRGQRQAWAISLALLGGVAVAELSRGGIEQAVLAAAVAALLWAKRRAFTAAVDRLYRRRGLWTVLIGTAATILLATGAVEVTLAMSRTAYPLGIGRALLAVAERMAGLSSVELPHRLDEFLTPVLTTIGIALALLASWLALRPVVARHQPSAADDLERAREIVKRHGSGTLDYFALRSDKHHYFYDDSVVSYGVYGSVCLVSPDPIGPETERGEVWGRFRGYADARGWAVAVLAAGEGWLPVYRAGGMHEVYLGDEGVVDVSRFTLEGGRHKALRQAVNRVERAGYTVELCDPARIGADLAARLVELMSKSRRGAAERGFSMTLGRLFDPADEGLLLAVASAPAGEPVAFCQFVPAPGIRGYSLDLMRRDRGTHPNGLMDFLITRTIEHLRELGMGGLGLNFAAMRGLIAGETGDSLGLRAQRLLLRRMSERMQIESLWRFNAKYDPNWQPRYAVYEAPELAPAVAMAIARAESFFEVPVLGRLLSHRSGAAGPGAGAGGREVL
ncbi:MAG: phosphatidylglycerol lysyltransferase domain-containing protein [Acidimicrobiales bacterium]